MEPYEYIDALSGSHVKFVFPGMQALQVGTADEIEECKTVFFPGCSFINYGMPLVQGTYDLLKNAGHVDGMSLLCCGKILSYEEDGKEKRVRYEGQLCDHLAAAGVKRIVTACPNCMKALRAALEQDPRVSHIKVTPLSVELEQMGYRIDPAIARAMIRDEYRNHPDVYEEACTDEMPDEDVLFTVHDTCPDRQLGEFAESLRGMLPDELYREAEHNRKNSFCCGSLVRAAGKYDLAREQSQRHGQEAVDVAAKAIVTPCMSCTFLLSLNQKRVPVFHYLELLFNYRIDWHTADEYMKIRFLFEDSWGVFDAETGEPTGRPFVGLNALG